MHLRFLLRSVAFPVMQKTMATFKISFLLKSVSAPIAAILVFAALPSVMAQNLVVGSNSSGQTTNFSSGSTYYSEDAQIGYNGSSNNAVISNGAQIQVYGLTYIGTAGNDNSVEVTGTGSSWMNQGQTFYVGYSGCSNQILITNGGSVLVEGGGYGIVGETSGSSNNSAIVTGDGSTWSNSGNLYVGDYGMGNSLVLTNGGTAYSIWGIIGVGDSASNNSAIVTGVGSKWSNLGSLVIGNSGSSNALTLANGGSVIAPTGLIIASYAGSSGTVNIGTYGGSDTAGAISAPTITFGSGNGSINFNQTDTMTLTSSITGHGTINQLGVGTSVLSADNSGYSGSILVGDGTLRAASATAYGNGTVAVTLSNTSGAILDLDGHNSSIGSLSGGGSNGGNVTLGTGTLTVGGANSSTTYAGVISGSGGIIKSGSGTQTLNGINSATGNTKVTGGTLKVGEGGALASSNTIVQSGGTLINNGSIAGTTTIQSGATLAGNRGNFSALALQGGSILTWNLTNAAGVAGTGWDLLNISNIDLSALSSNNKLTINILGTPLNFSGQDYAFEFFNVSGSRTTFNPEDFLINTDGLTLASGLSLGTWSVAVDSRNSDALDVVYTAVPEPCSYVLFGGAFLVMTLVLRSTHRRAIVASQKH